MKHVMKKFFIITLLISAAIQFPAFARPVQPQKAEHIEYMNLAWWEKYNDEYLTENLLKLYENNYDLKNAALKVKENEQAVKIQFANELPQIGLSGQLYRDMRSSMKQYGSMQIPSYA